jgi:hypothetical protein
MPKVHHAFTDAGVDDPEQQQGGGRTGAGWAGQQDDGQQRAGLGGVGAACFLAGPGSAGLSR